MSDQSSIETERRAAVGSSALFGGVSLDKAQELLLKIARQQKEIEELRKHSISGNRLRALVINAHQLLGKRYRGSPLWSLVSDLTGHGSTVSCDICTSVNLNPCQPCGGNKLSDANVPPPNDEAQRREPEGTTNHEP